MNSLPNISIIPSHQLIFVYMKYHFPDAKFPQGIFLNQRAGTISSLNVKKPSWADAISARMLKTAAVSIDLIQECGFKVIIIYAAMVNAYNMTIL